MGYESDAAIQEFLAAYKQPPQTYLAMQAEGREWTSMFSQEIVSRFDYVFTDAMTWTNDNGKRMRLWIKEETEAGDAQNFMDQLVDRIEKILNNEPVDIYVNPTYLPEDIKDSYDELWTTERMDRVIKALADNKVALEINDRYQLPSAAFIKRAKAAGVKFTFGTNNGGADDLGRLEYCIQMAEECGLTSDDMWLPQLHRK
jgi:histidinol phosphatase-like PHP family hydrolase